MATDIGARIGVEGEQDFKQSLRSITQTGKELAAEMKSVSAQFKNTESSETELNAKTKILQQQIANATAKVSLLTTQYNNQNKKLAELGAKLEDARNKYGENSVEAQKAEKEYNNFAIQCSKTKTQLNNASEELYNAENALKEVQDPAKETAEDIEEVGKSSKDAGKESKLFGDILKAEVFSKAIIEGAKALAKAIVDIVKGISEAYKESVDWSDELVTLSKNSGISTQKLQELQYAEGLLDVETGLIINSLKQLTRNIDKNSETYERLGVSVYDANGQFRNSYDIFLDTIDALGEIENVTERDNISMSLFGRSAQELNTLILAGSNGLKEFANEAEEVGYVLDDKAIARLNDSADAFDRFNAMLDAIKRTGASAFAPIVTYITNSVLPALSQAVKLISDFANGDINIGTFINRLAEGFNQFVNEFTKLALPIIQGLVKGLLENLPVLFTTSLEILAEIVSYIGENAQLLIPAAIECINALANGLMSNVGNLLSAAVDLVVGLAEGITSPQAIEALINAAPQLITSLILGIIQNLPRIIASGPEIIFALISGIISALGNLLMAGANSVNTFANGLKTFDFKAVGSDFVKRMVAGISDAIGKIKEAVQSVVSAFKNALSPLSSSARTWGSDMMSGLISGLQAKLASLRNVVNTIASTISRVLHFSRPDEGPLRDYETWMPDMLAGMAKGLIDNRSILENAAMQVGGGLSSAFNGVGITGKGFTGGINIVVNGAEGQDVNALADAVIDRISIAMDRKMGAFA